VWLNVLREENRNNNEWVEPVKPAPLSAEIDVFGVVYIAWNTQMITDSTVAMKLNKSGRLLQDSGEEANYDFSDFLELKLVQNSETELVPAPKLEYSYSTDWYNSTLQRIKIDFVAPDYVSQSNFKDEITIKFNDTSAFASE